MNNVEHYTLVRARFTSGIAGVVPTESRAKSMQRIEDDAHLRELGMNKMCLKGKTSMPDLRR